MSHRRLRFLLTLAAALFLLVASGVVYRQLKLATYNPEQPLQVGADGSIRQGTHYVGSFQIQEDQGVVLIPLPTNTTEAQSYVLEFNLPASLAGQPLSTHFDSIQGVEGMRVVRRSPTTLLAIFDEVLPNSYTAFQLSVPRRYLHLPLTVRFASAVHDFSLLDWMEIAGSIVLCALLYAFKVMRMVPRARGEQPTPGDLTPLEAGIILHGRVTAPDIAGTLINLANRGHLEIVLPQDEALFLRREGHDQLRSEEHLLLDALVPDPHKPSRISAIVERPDTHLFSPAVSGMYAQVYDSFAQRGFTVRNPRLIHLEYKVVGIILQLIGVAQTVVSYLFLSYTLHGMLLLGLALYLVGVIVYHAGYRVGRLTTDGKRTVQQLVQFRNYLSADRAIGAEGMYGDLLYQYLPYAITLGVAHAWCERFAAVSCAVPDWLIAFDQYYTPTGFINRVQTIVFATAKLLNQLKEPDAE